LSDTKVYEPYIRARLGTAAHFCEIITSWRGWQEKVEVEEALKRQAQDTATMQKKEAQVPCLPPERGFYIDNLLVRIHLIIEMIRWTGLAPWEFEFPFPGSLPPFPSLYASTLDLERSLRSLLARFLTRRGNMSTR